MPLSVGMSWLPLSERTSQPPRQRPLSISATSTVTDLLTSFPMEKVYFNHLEFDGSGNAVPTFTLSSADTPSPIIYGGKVDTSVMEVSKDEQAEAIRTHRWRILCVYGRPKDGTVSVAGQVSLVAPTGDYDADEYQRQTVWGCHPKGWQWALEQDDCKRVTTVHTAAAVSSVAVKRGDRIYFRVQSGSEETNGSSFDKVNWSPTITYAGGQTSLPNGLSSTEYKPEDGAIMMWTPLPMWRMDQAWSSQCLPQACNNRRCCSQHHWQQRQERQWRKRQPELYREDGLCSYIEG